MPAILARDEACRWETPCSSGGFPEQISSDELHSPYALDTRRSFVLPLLASGGMSDAEGVSPVTMTLRALRSRQ